MKSDFDFSKWNFYLQHDFTDGRIGQLSYTIDAGLTNGVLPIVLLNVLKGNDTYYYNKYAFNNMNRFEFVTDKYASLAVQQSFGSFPFRYFPVMKRLKWRSLVTFRGVLGDMSQANKIANGYYDTTINYHFTIPDKNPLYGNGIWNRQYFPFDKNRCGMAVELFKQPRHFKIWYQRKYGIEVLIRDLLKKLTSLAR